MPDVAQRFVIEVTHDEFDLMLALLLAITGGSLIEAVEILTKCRMRLDKMEGAGADNFVDKLIAVHEQMVLEGGECK